MDQFILAILVDNHFGVLTRVTSLFSRRCFNIDSLTVGETEDPDTSRITVAVRGDEYVKEQIMKQLSKLHNVKGVEIMLPEKTVCRELLLIKVRTSPQTKQDVMDAVTVFRGNIIDYTASSVCVEMTGETSKTKAFIELMSQYGIIEMCRTGVVSLERGTSSLINK